MRPEDNAPDMVALRHLLGQLTADKRRTVAQWLRHLDRQDRMAKKDALRASQSLRSAVICSALSLLLFFFAEAAVFRTGFYLRYLEPDSSAGTVEGYLHWLNRNKPTSQPEIMVIGDSRIAEGFSARVATAAQSHFKFWNFGIGGTSPRDWYYMLRDADPDRRRFAAIVIGLDHYVDRDAGDDLSNRLLDENYLIGRLRLGDCWDFSRSFSDTALRYGVFKGCLFKGMTLRHDIQEFFPSRKDRLTRSRDYRDHGLGYIDGYGGKPEDLVGLSVDWGIRAITFPPDTKDWQRNSVRASLTPEPFPQSGTLTRYRQAWFGKIFQLYAGAGTRIILVENPRGPLPTSDDGVSRTFLTSIRNTPGLTILSDQTFRDLEQPKYFADGAHLNHTGRPIFSERLADQVSLALSAH